MKPSHYLSVLIFFLLSNAPIFGQSKYYRQFTDQDGLISMNVYQVNQDKNGLIWLATDNGICSFDGKTFEKRIHPKMNGQDFIGLYKAPNGQLWFWNWSGQVFYLENNNIQYYSPDGFLDDKRVGDLIVDIDGNAWMEESFNKNQSFFCDSKGNCKLITSKDKLSKTIKILTRNESNIGKSFNTGSISSVIDYDILKKFPIEDGVGFLGRLIYKGNKQWLYLGSDIGRGKIRILNTDSTELRLSQVINLNPNTRILSYFVGQNQETWLITNRGLKRYNKNFEGQEVTIPRLKDISINSLFQDKNGNMWLGCSGEGIWYIPKRNLTTFNSLTSSLTSNDINSFKVRHHDILTMSGNGELISFAKNGVLKHQYQVGFKTNFIHKLQDGSGFLVASADRLYQYSNDIRLIQKYNLGNIKTLTEFEGILISSKRDGITPHEDWHSPHTVGAITISSFIQQNGPVYTFQAAKKGGLYAGALSGLLYYDNKKITQVDYTDNENLNNAFVQDIEYDKKGNLWLATDAGIAMLQNEKLAKHYTLANGLLNEDCKQIVVDEDLIWIATNKGVHVLNTKNDSIYAYTIADGLPANRINAVLAVGDSIWVGSSRGVSLIDKKAFFKPTTLFPVFIHNIRINGNDTTFQPHYRMEFNSNNFVFEFTSPNYDKQTITYFHRLKNYNDNWTSTTGNEVQYTNLPAGNYTFEIYAQDEKGRKSRTNQSIQITIKKPIWQTWWFYLLSMLIGAAIVSFITYLIVTAYRKQRERQLNFRKELSETKMQALQAQMNPHFIFNALNAIQHFFTTDTRELAMLHLNKFARLIRLIFEYSKVPRISLYKEAKFLKLYIELEKLRFGDTVEIDFNIDKNINVEDVFILPLLIQPMVENAFKHGLLHKQGDGHLRLSMVQVSKEYIKCTVEDDGVGREVAQAFKNVYIKEQTSSGLKNTRERISLYNQEYGENAIQFKIIDLKDDKGRANGTRVEFLIKVERTDEEF